MSVTEIAFFSFSSFKFDSLSQWQIFRVVDSAGGSPHVLLPRVAAALPSAAGGFFAAKGAANFRAGSGNVDVDDAAVAALWTEPAENIAHIAGKDGGGEALFDGIVDRNRIIETFALENVEDGCEGLSRHDGRIRRQSRHYRRLHVISGAIEQVSAYLHGSTLSLGIFDRRQIAVQALLRMKGSAEGSSFERVADAHLLVGFDQAGDDFVVDVFVDDETAETGAALSGGADGGEEDCRNDHVQVAIRHDDQGVVAAQFQEGFAEARLNIYTDLSSDGCASREGNERNAGIVGHGASDVGVTANEGGNGAVDAILLQNLRD